MSTWTEYDPHQGLVERNRYDEDAKAFVVRKEQDVTALIDRNKELANTGATDLGIKKGLWHYASVPLVVQYELLTKYGLNIHNKNHTDRIFQVINKDYPYLKTTSKVHYRKRSA